MAKISAVEIPALLFDEQGSAPTTPGTGLWKIYFKSDGLYIVDDAGAETGPFATSAGSFTGARLRRSTTQSIPTSTWTSIEMDVEDLDVGGFHEGVTNPSRATVPSGQGGVYAIGGNAGFGTHDADRRSYRLLVNGTTQILDLGAEVAHTFATGSPSRMAGSTIYDLSVGDYVELQAWQDTGGNLDISPLSESLPQLWLYKLG